MLMRGKVCRREGRRGLGERGRCWREKRWGSGFGEEREEGGWGEGGREDVRERKEGGEGGNNMDLLVPLICLLPHSSHSHTLTSCPVLFAF